MKCETLMQSVLVKRENEMIVIVIAVAIFAAVLVFVYLMGHPSPKEPRFIYNLRRHPSAIPEYVALLGYGLFRPRLFCTGATRQEKGCPLPGDELVARPQLKETRATTINVPASQLWPWIVQMGGGRGGYYWWTPGEAFPEYAQYIVNTYDVLPQFQQLNVGDRLSDGGPYSTEERGTWEVRAIEPGRHLVLYAARQVSGGADFDRSQLKPKGIWFICSWVFVLEPLEAEKTRLMVRVRGVGGPPMLMAALRLVFKGDTVAHSSLFERVKARAEARYARQEEAAAALSSKMPNE